MLLDFERTTVPVRHACPLRIPPSVMAQHPSCWLFLRSSGMPWLAPEASLQGNEELLALSLNAHGLRYKSSLAGGKFHKNCNGAMIRRDHGVSRVNDFYGENAGSQKTTQSKICVGMCEMLRSVSW
jgi:hypothetical protein